MARKSGLGKGLEALIPQGERPADNNAATTGGPLREIPLDQIIPNQYQPRQTFAEDSLQALADSIRAMGVIQPIIVRVIPDATDQFELIAGERRWRASKLAGLAVIPALVQTDVDDTLSLERAIVENLHRVDLNALEEAAAYQQLIEDFSLTHEQVAARVGKNRATVTNFLRLLQLGVATQAALAEGQISAGHARALLSVTDHNAQAALVAKVIGNELSVRATEEAVRDLLEAKPTTGGGGKPRLRPVPDATIAELEHLLAELLETRVRVDLKGKTGRVVIDFADVDDLERIYVAMTKKP